MNIQDVTITLHTLQHIADIAAKIGPRRTGTTYSTRLDTKPKLNGYE